MTIRNVTVRSEAGQRTYHSILQEHPDHTRYSHGECEDPIWCHLAPPDDVSKDMAPVALLTLRCGRCPDCRQRRARRYIAQNIREAEDAPRVWMTTPTLPPAYFAGMTDYREKELAILTEGTKAIKRLRQRLRAKGRKLTFRFWLTTEMHTGKRVPDHKPTAQTGNPHLHILIFEYEGNRVTNDDIDLMWCNFPKFTKIPDRAEDALRLAEARGWKLGNIDTHLEYTIDPKDKGRSNKYGRDPAEAVAYASKYLAKDAFEKQSRFLDPDSDGTEAGEGTLPDFRKPPPVRHSLFWGLGGTEATKRERRLRRKMRSDRIWTRLWTTAGHPRPGETPSGEPRASGEHGQICPLSDFKESLQGSARSARSWTPREGWEAWIESAMEKTRLRYATMTQPKVIAAAELMRRARDGPYA